MFEKSLVLGLVASLTACGDGRIEPNADVPTDLQVDLKAVLDGAVASKATPGVALHVATGRGSTWSTAAGVGDVETNTLLEPNERFRAGSILKTFVATAVLKAIERGTLGLYDVLTDRLPPEVTARIQYADKIRIDMLLGHRSGIPDWINGQMDQAVVADPEHIYSLDEILGQVTKLPPVFEPGKDFRYSNTNYVLLGEILTRAEGRSWREVIREQVLSPCGLEESSLPEAGDPSCPPPCAHGYVVMGGELHDTTEVDPSMSAAAGGHALLTTPADIARFFRLLRRGDLFDRASTLDAMFAFRPEAQDRRLGYGFGVMKIETIYGPVVGHFGATAGYGSFMLYIAATDRYVSGFMNSTADLDFLIGPIIARAAMP